MNKIKLFPILARTSIFVLAIFTVSAFAQSTDPDKPISLTKNSIAGSSSGGLSDEKSYYYAFDVKPGTLTMTLDVIPVNKSDGGGLVQWTLMTTKFAKLKYDNLSAQGTEERQVKDLKITIKRRIIMKITVSGNINYKFKFEGNAATLLK
ncbi:MAG: hypothetical protein ABIP06_15265 [Pyrinomonadaceae bacterium]